jgi:hypothetical protein
MAQNRYGRRQGAEETRFRRCQRPQASMIKQRICDGNGELDSTEDRGWLFPGLGITNDALWVASAGSLVSSGLVSVTLLSPSWEGVCCSWFRGLRDGAKQAVFGWVRYLNSMYCRCF